MLSKTNPETGPSFPWGQSSWAFVGILVLAAALRLARAGQWSLWEDEETAIYFSQNLDRRFPSYFPIFFALLRGVYSVTGVSVFAGRVLCAVVGVASIGAIYLLGRRVATERVANWAALFVTVSVGHLFWSQSIRYYVLLFLFQILSMYLYIDGFESGRIRRIVASAVFLLLGLWCHFSGILLLPVYVGHLALALVCGWRHGSYNRRGYLTFAIAFGIVAALFAWQFSDFRAHLSGLISPKVPRALAGLLMRRATLLVRLAVYLGLPVLALAFAGLWVAPQKTASSVAAFLCVAAWLPLLELVVIASLQLALVTWYYAFFALGALAILAGISVEHWRARWPRLTPAGVALVGFAFYGPLLASYYTSMHGDRPRWRDAAQAIQRATNAEGRDSLAHPIFATVPGTVAFHLGIPPSKTMGHPGVVGFPAAAKLTTDQPIGFFVVEASVLNAEQRDWLQKQCDLVAKFPAVSGPKDRTVFVYYRAGSGPDRGASPTRNRD